MRIAFSDDIETSYRDLDDGFEVTGGSITSVRRVNGRSDLWDIEVEPSGDADVTLTLAGGRACTVTGAPCTDDGRTLTGTLVVTVPGPEEEDTPTPLTARIDDGPAEHDGESAFMVRIAFSAPITASKNKFRQAFDVTNGRVAKTERVDGRSDLWTVKVVPAGFETVTIVLRGNRPCGSGGVPCARTPDGNGRIPLSNTLSIDVRGPAAISVAGARAHESDDETIDCVVSLDRVALRTITVDYTTRDGTATAGEDYTAKSGRLRFSIGERSKTVRITLLDDARDEGEETFEFVLSNPTGAYIADGTATGTIENDDPLQQAWIARFGRTVGRRADKSYLNVAWSA